MQILELNDVYIVKGRNETITQNMYRARRSENKLLKAYRSTDYRKLIRHGLQKGD